MEVKRIALMGLSNTRDLGGISGESGAPVKERRLIRSGALFHGAGADLSVLREAYGVHTVIDLRTAVEAENEPDPAFPGWDIRRLPLLDDSFFGIARDAYSVEAWFNMFQASDDKPGEIFFRMYRKLAFDPHSVDIFRRFFGVLLENEAGAVLWHCSAGKDRAGMAAALTLLALGLPEELIVYDYMQTAVFTADEIEAVRGMVAARGADARSAEAMEVLMNVDETYLPRIFNEMRARFGSTAGYFTENGILTAGELTDLRRLYLK